MTERVSPSWFDGSLSYDEIPTCNFSTWEGFGKLWEWSKRQEWWLGFVVKHTYKETKEELTSPISCIIKPSLFAEAIYAYLKRVEGEG